MQYYSPPVECDIPKSRVEVSSFISNATMLIQLLMLTVLALAATYMYLKDRSMGGIIDIEMPERVRSLAKYETWFRENNGWMHPNVALSQVADEGIGLVLKGSEALEAGTKIVEVPKKLHINRNNTLEIFIALGDDLNLYGKKLIAKRLLGEDDPLTPLDVLTLRLLYESCHGENSTFAPYLSYLPRTTVPLLFTMSEQELTYIQDEGLETSAMQLAKRIKNLWLDTHPVMRLFHPEVNNREPPCLTLEEYRRFYSIAASRSVMVEDELSLVPMADALNHKVLPVQSGPPPSLHSIGESGSLIVHTDRTTSSTETSKAPEIYEEYDRHDNSQHIAGYGFVSVDNPYHCVVLKEMWKYVPHRALRQSLYEARDALDWNQGTACVRKDRTYTSDRMVDILVAIYELLLNPNEEKVENCVQSIRDATTSMEAMSLDQRLGLVAEKCGVDTTANAVRTLPNQWTSPAARAVIEETSKKATTVSSLQNDIRLLQDIQNHRSFLPDVNPKRVALALEFRIEEQKVLMALGMGDMQQPRKEAYHSEL